MLDKFGPNFGPIYPVKGGKRESLSAIGRKKPSKRRNFDYFPALEPDLADFQSELDPLGAYGTLNRPLGGKGKVSRPWSR